MFSEQWMNRRLIGVAVTLMLILTAAADSFAVYCPADRIQAQGYSYSTWGENIAAGYASPESVVDGWMNSEGHRANILNCGTGHRFLQPLNADHDTGRGAEKKQSPKPAPTENFRQNRPGNAFN